MNRKLFFILIFVFLVIRNTAAFDFEVECNSNIVSDPKVTNYFQNYIGKWSGEWKKNKHFDINPDRIKEIAKKFNYDDFQIEVLSIKGCDVIFKVNYSKNIDVPTIYKEELMTEEGLYLYWNSPTMDGTYILIYDEENKILNGVFQLFEGQNIASIIMKRL